MLNYIASFFIEGTILINNLSKNSVLKLVPIHIRKDKKNYIIEDIESGDFYEMPDICISAIELMNNDKPLEKIEVQLNKEYPEEKPDLIDFAEQLLDLGLVYSIDGQRVKVEKFGTVKRGFIWIPTNAGFFFFNRITSWIYGSLFLFSLLLIAINPTLMPNFKDIFVFESVTLSMLFWMAITFTSVLIHELGHILALRAKELPAQLGIGHRLFLIVFETDMTAAWRLESKSRNVLFLSGLCFDSVLLFSGLALQLVVNEANIIHAVLRLLVLDCTLRMGYQLGVYMKTDLYYVIENTTGAYNLMENANKLIKRLLPNGRNKENQIEFPEEKKTILIYAVVYLLGLAATFTFLIFFYIPQLGFALKKVVPNLASPPNSPAFWDALVFTLQLAVGLGFLLYSWSKKYLTHEQN